jgi:coatomer subunit beta
LDRLIALKDHPSHERVLQDLVMDILRVLSSTDLEVRKKTLNLGNCLYCFLFFIINGYNLFLYFCLALDLVSSRNIEEMVFVLKNEVEKTHNLAEHEDTGKYRQLLVRTLHTCSIKVCF